MLTNKLTQLMAITGLFALAACGEDKDDEGTTNVSTVTLGDDGSDSGSNSMTDASMTMTDPTATTGDTDPTATTDTDPTAGTDTGGECPAGSECQTSADCDFGVMCVDCMCEGGDSTGTPGDDPYPPPMNGMCPAGYGSIDPMQAGGNVCAPPCEAMFTCPEPTSGTAMGACALVEPGASMDPCETVGEACPTDPEICLMFQDGTFCSNPPAWCFLSCMGGAICPDGQMCGPQMICVWPE